MEKPTLPAACLRQIGSSGVNHKYIALEAPEFVIGRAKEVNYAIPDLVISRRHAVFRYNKDQWTIESLGMNGVTLNHVMLPNNRQIPLSHMDTIEFGPGSKLLYAFRILSLETACEPNAKKLRMPFANHNVPSLKESPAAFKSWVKSKKSLELTLTQESDTLDLKLQQQKSLNEELIQERKKLEEETANFKKELESKLAQERRELEEKVARGDLEKNELQKEKENLEWRMTCALEKFQEECSRKTKELEESLSNANDEKRRLLEEKEFIVQQLTREKDLLEEQLQEESRLRAATLDELAKLKESRTNLEKQWEEERRRFEEEKEQMQRKESEDETRLSRMSSELAERKAQLDAKEKEVAEIQSRAALGLEMLEALEVIQHENSNNGDIVIVLGGEQEQTLVAQPPKDSTEIELERIREELKTQMELKEQELKLVSRQIRDDILGKLETVMENELNCGICSELMVFATSLTCMHTFCQYCVQTWKARRAECPVCRQPITSQGRNLVVDNMINAIVANMSEEVQTKRKELVALRIAVAHQDENKNRNSTDSRAGGRRPRQETAPVRAPAQRRTLPANHPGAVQPIAVRPAIAVHASAATARTARTASRPSVTSMGTAGGARQAPIPWVAAPAPPAPNIPQRQINQWVAAPPPPAPASNQRVPSHRIAAHSVPAHTGRDQPGGRRRRVSFEDSNEVVVLSSDSDSYVSVSEGVAGNDSVMVVDERLTRPRRRRRMTCQRCGQSTSSSSRCTCVG